MDNRSHNGRLVSGRCTPLGARAKLDTSVGKALALLEAFQDAGRSVGVTHLAATAGLPKSTAYRLLGILLDWGLVERSGTGYCLGAHLFELGNAIPSRGRQRAA